MYIMYILTPYVYSPTLCILAQPVGDNVHEIIKGEYK